MQEPVGCRVLACWSFSIQTRKACMSNHDEGVLLHVIPVMGSPRAVRRDTLGEVLGLTDTGCASSCSTGPDRPSSIAPCECPPDACTAQERMSRS